MTSPLRVFATICYATILFVAPVWLVGRSGEFNPQSASEVKDTQSNQGKGKNKKEIPPPYGFSETSPPGHWAAVAAMVDSEQTENPDVPVVIVGLGAYAGKGAWAKQLMVDNLMLINRGSSEAITVKVGWSIINADTVRATMNRNSPLLRKSSLLEGSIELPTSISPGKMQTLSDLQIDFVKRARELIRSEKLRGEAVIRLRVAEATFMDGSVWHEQTAIAKSRNHRATAPPPPPGCPNVDCFFENNGQGYCTFPSLGFYCKRINCAVWDPNACYCQQYSCTLDCHDNDHDGVDICEGDCDDEDPARYPGNYEYYPENNCYDGKDNDCDPGSEIDCANFLCQNTAPGCELEHCVECENNDDCCDGEVCHSGWCGPPELACICPPDTICYEGLCSYATPIVIDVDGDGFQLTSAAGGVDFDFEGDGSPRRIAWTAAGADDAWLVLDRNHNRRIDSAREMFGNITPQPRVPLEDRNGFLALAEFDKSAKGGNGDGIINRQDSVFRALRLWTDSNHNGTSEWYELFSMEQRGLEALRLNYKESRRVDQYGNGFRYRAKVNDAHGAQIGRWAWDVTLKLN